MFRKAWGYPTGYYPVDRHPLLEKWTPLNGGDCCVRAGALWPNPLRFSKLRLSISLNGQCPNSEGLLTIWRRKFYPEASTLQILHFRFYTLTRILGGSLSFRNLGWHKVPRNSNECAQNSMQGQCEDLLLLKNPFEGSRNALGRGSCRKVAARLNGHPFILCCIWLHSGFLNLWAPNLNLLIKWSTAKAYRSSDRFDENRLLINARFGAKVDRPFDLPLWWSSIWSSFKETQTTRRISDSFEL